MLNPLPVAESGRTGLVREGGRAGEEILRMDVVVN